MDKIRENIKDLSKAELAARLKKMAAEPYRANQIFRHLYITGVKSFDGMTDMPEALRKWLKEEFRITHPAMADSRRSSLDGTTKYLLKLDDGNTIETVFLPDGNRATACLSSQVGCKYGCSFCASAGLGFIRNLAQSEILDEVIFLREKNPDPPITNLVFMGIGEPMDNFDNVMSSIRVFNDKVAFNIGARRMTISTCGIIPGIERLKGEGLQVELSVSLHSADDSVRSKLVPVNKKYPLKDLMRACVDYIEKTGRVITFEYVLIKDVNSSAQDALSLAKLLKGVKCKVNTISHNRTAAGIGQPSGREAKDFVNILKQNGINATHRKSRGEDIDAGCGQLRISTLHLQRKDKQGEEGA
ncbi:MAG: 23S rRNA (adenine(2503)-C(2))-methyltransferase RlmN [Candidatus Omnitrophota bacterium]